VARRHLLPQEPMDFQTIEQRVSNGSISTVDELEKVRARSPAPPPVLHLR
jgi:hypothetical protein